MGYGRTDEYNGPHFKLNGKMVDRPVKMGFGHHKWNKDQKPSSSRVGFAHRFISDSGLDDVGGGGGKSDTTDELDGTDI